MTNDSIEGLASEALPADAGPVRRALACLARGDREGAHAVVQGEAGAACARIHAHVHRVEGDEANAAYWYRRAGTSVCRDALESELETLVRELL